MLNIAQFIYLLYNENLAQIAKYLVNYAITTESLYKFFRCCNQKVFGVTFGQLSLMTKPIKMITGHRPLKIIKQDND